MSTQRIFRSDAFAYWPIAAALILGMLLTGCAKIRLLTYPNNFVWIDKEDVKGTMDTMYQSIQHLDALLDYETPQTNIKEQAELKRDVISELKRLEIIAASLATGTSSGNNIDSETPATNHLLISEHMDDFIQQISQARFRVEADPPRYFKAGQLVGECNACHRER